MGTAIHRQYSLNIDLSISVRYSIIDARPTLVQLITSHNRKTDIRLYPNNIGNLGHRFLSFLYYMSIRTNKIWTSTRQHDLLYQKIMILLIITNLTFKAQWKLWETLSYSRDNINWIRGVNYFIYSTYFCFSVFQFFFFWKLISFGIL